jgi:hypothetical protein
MRRERKILMRLRRFLFLSAIILITACGITTPSPTKMPATQSRLSPEPSLPTPTTVPVFITIDDFEDSETAWKAGNWEFRASTSDLNNVHRLAIIIYPAGSGSAIVDDIRINSVSPTPE